MDSRVPAFADQRMTGMRAMRTSVAALLQVIFTTSTGRVREQSGASEVEKVSCIRLVLFRSSYG